MMFDDFQVVAVLDWEMAGGFAEIDLGWMAYLPVLQDISSSELPGCPTSCRPGPGRDLRRPPPGAPAICAGVAYAAMRHGVIMRRV